MRLLSLTRPRAGAGLFVSMAGLLVGLAGCQPAEGIHRTAEPKFEMKKPEPSEVRLIAAFAEPAAGENSLFIVMNGPAEAVASHESEFQEFVRNVNLQGREPNDFQTLKGWELGPVKQMRVATYYPDPADRKLEVRISGASWDGDTEKALLANVNRFRGLVGLSEAAPEQAAEQLKHHSIGGRPGYLLDVTGPGSKKGPAMMGR